MDTVTLNSQNSKISCISNEYVVSHLIHAYDIVVFVPFLNGLQHLIYNRICNGFMVSRKFKLSVRKTKIHVV